MHDNRATNAAQDACCAVIELRQYTLHPGKRDTLIDLFDREFVESQEALGMQVIGQFRDLDDPDRFVWLRGFADLPTRARALADFYGGPVWKAHRELANSTMVDSDNVLLLQPAYGDCGFSSQRIERAAPDARGSGAGLVVATLYYFDDHFDDHFDAPAEADFLEWFARDLAPVLAETGAPVSATLVSHPGPNDFPALPVREGEHVFAWFARFADPAAYERHRDALAALPRWRDELAPALRRLPRAPETLRLCPTARSRLHG